MWTELRNTSDSQYPFTSAVKGNDKMAEDGSFLFGHFVHKSCESATQHHLILSSKTEHNILTESGAFPGQ